MVEPKGPPKPRSGLRQYEWLSNSGGKLDDILSSIGVGLLVAAGCFLGHAMALIPGWQAWAWPARRTAVLILAFAIADVAGSALDGLFERLVAAVAAAITALAAGILRRSRT